MTPSDPGRGWWERTGTRSLVYTAAQLDRAYIDSLAKDSVFAIHAIDARKAGNVFERRRYIIEGTSGAMMLFTFSTLMRLGKVYIADFRMTSQEADIRVALEGGSWGRVTRRTAACFTNGYAVFPRNENPGGMRMSRATLIALGASALGLVVHFLCVVLDISASRKKATDKAA